MNPLFFIQDKRKTKNGIVSWWAKNSFGHTTDLAQAEKYTLKEAYKHYQNRETDLPWPVDYILQRTQITIEQNEINILQALNCPELQIENIEKQNLKQN